MKYFVIFIILLLNNIISAQNWKCLNPYPTSNVIQAMQFLDAYTGFAVGGYGTIIKTTDSGKSWINLHTGTTDDLYSLSFIDENIGFAAGGTENWGSILRTTDGGNTWIYLNLLSARFLNFVSFINKDTGFAGGSGNGDYETTDGGINWFSTNYSNSEMCFSNSLIGYALGDNQDYPGIVFKTTNCGNSWFQVDSNAFANSIFCFDSNRIFCAGNKGNYFISDDSGIHWTKPAGISNQNLNTVFFIDSLNGYAAGDSGTILKTTDGGRLWMNRNCNPLFYLNTLYFINSDTGFVSGGYSYNNYWVPNTSVILKTTDGGINWFEPHNNIRYNLNSVFFNDSLTGFVVGEAGSIYKTTNGGINWISLNSFAVQNLNSIFFINKDTGYVVGNEGTIVKTVDGGNTWSIQNRETVSPLYSVFFTDNNNGYVVGNKLILNTTDGGEHWISQGFDDLINSVFFIDSITGYFAGGYDGAVLEETTDGGKSWNYTAGNFWANGYGEITFQSVTANKLNNVFVVGEDDNQDAGLIYNTSDAGNNWNLVYNDFYKNLLSVSFADKYTGLVVGVDWGSYSDGIIGCILQSTDAGESWVSQIPYTYDQLNSVYCPDANTAYAVGNGGVILKAKFTESTVGINKPTTNMPQLSTNIYPNPVNQSSIISYQLPYNSHVNIEIFDITGKSIAVLVDEEKIKGNYKVNINAENLKSGIYFYKLTTDKGFETEKFAIIHL